MSIAGELSRSHVLSHTSVISNITKIHFACVPKKVIFQIILYRTLLSTGSNSTNCLSSIRLSLAFLCINILQSEKLNGIVITISHPQFSQEHFFALQHSNFRKSFLDCHDPRRTEETLVFLIYKASQIFSFNGFRF